MLLLLAVRTTLFIFMTASWMIIHRATSLQMWSSIAAPNFSRSSATVRIASRSLSTRRSNIIMMPEGPEVKILIDQLQPAVGMRLVSFKFLSGRYVTHGRPNRYDEFVNTMTPYTGIGRHENVGAGTVDIITKLHDVEIREFCRQHDIINYSRDNMHTQSCAYKAW